MNVLNLAFFVDDDPYGDGVESALRENRILSLEDVLVARVILEAQRDVTAARPRNGSRLWRQVHRAHLLDKTLYQLGVAAGKDELNRVAADFGSHDVPVQLGHGRNVTKPNEGMAGDGNRRRRLLHFVVRVQMVLGVIDQIEGASGWG